MDVSQINNEGTFYNIEDTAARRMHSQLYPLSDGADLAEKFASEISKGGFSSVWAWIQSRIQAGNFAGINVGDYISFMAGGNAIVAEVAGINTYLNYGDTAVGNHIDFISRDCWPDPIQWNLFNYNNGTEASPNPWLACNLYAKLNSLAMQVPGSAAAGGAPLQSVDYANDGVWDKLPAALRNVIVEKRTVIERRYTAGSLLVDNNSGDWANVGKLWVPSEVEVYGCPIWGSGTLETHGFGAYGFVQYPIFAQNMKRVKGAGNGGARSTWWLLSVRGGTATHACTVHHYGSATTSIASHTTIRAPLCFRIA